LHQNLGKLARNFCPIITLITLYANDYNCVAPIPIVASFGETVIDVGLIMAAVAGKTAVVTPELAAFVTAAPATVKCFAATPVKVKPGLAVSVMVAV
jgi:hypothetical protein